RNPAAEPDRAGALEPAQGLPRQARDGGRAGAAVALRRGRCRRRRAGVWPTRLAARRGQARDRRQRLLGGYSVELGERAAVTAVIAGLPDEGRGDRGRGEGLLPHEAAGRWAA